jgi:hypothetical protein
MRATCTTRAQRWRRTGMGDAGWASCPLTQNGFVRICTQASYKNPLPLPDALDIIQRLAARSDHQFWPDDVSVLDRDLIDRSRLLGPRQITDVRLLALAVKHGGRLVTLDTGISWRAVRGATKEQLVVV